ncbi:putative adenylate cyclase regulatory protein [Rhodamnia argentea]|uniref:Adenylate cyclase regulatory protein n=1 Tax=Rhodamnia argentea TaxID=178133 RepID=A0ABM3HH96_9MYRT|nr:putative adenylate cyclase regulatory protein [Rhodamnia argentea]
MGNLLTLRVDSCWMPGRFRAVRLKPQKRMLDAPFQLRMESLRHLEMRRCAFTSKVLDLSCMKNLQEVHLLGCKWLVEIRGLEDLGSLCSLSVVECNSLGRLSDLWKLRKLRKLRVGECPKLRSLEDINHLKSLRKLWIHDCRSLESLADTSNLDLECSTVERCERLADRNSYCRCHDNRDSALAERDHTGYFLAGDAEPDLMKSGN